jgi:hypothetical protein
MLMRVLATMLTVALLGFIRPNLAQHAVSVAGAPNGLSLQNHRKAFRPVQQPGTHIALCALQDRLQWLQMVHLCTTAMLLVQPHHHLRLRLPSFWFWLRRVRLRSTTPTRS